VTRAHRLHVLDRAEIAGAIGVVLEEGDVEVDMREHELGDCVVTAGGVRTPSWSVTATDVQRGGGVEAFADRTVELRVEYELGVEVMALLRVKDAIRGVT
jgi:hypothetical protein